MTRKVSPAEGLCNICGKLASLRCGKCRSRKYCSQECQVLDWQTHEEGCFSQTATTRPSQQPTAVGTSYARNNKTNFNIPAHAQQLLANGYTVIDGFVGDSCARALLAGLSAGGGRAWAQRGFENGQIGGGMVGEGAAMSVSQARGDKIAHLAAGDPRYCFQKLCHF